MESLCETCLHVRAIVSARGSRFLLCNKSLHDERYAKYPRQPIVTCGGYDERTDEHADTERLG